MLTSMVSGMTTGQRPQDAVWAGKMLLFVFYFTKYKKLTDNGGACSFLPRLYS
jgi:hypothetical protein